MSLAYVIVIMVLILVITLHHNRWILDSILYYFENDLKVNGGFFSYMWIYKEVFNEGDYVTSLPIGGTTVLDIGSNVGVFSLWINDHYRDVTVHCFDPIPELYESTQENTSKCAKNGNHFIVNNFGLSDKSEMITMKYFPHASGLSTAFHDISTKEKEFGKIGSWFDRIVWNSVTKVTEHIPCKLYRIEDYLIHHKIDSVSLCKIDVEGCEEKVVRGFGSKIDIVDEYIIEIENYRQTALENIVKFLKYYDIEIENQDKPWCILRAKKRN